MKNVLKAVFVFTLLLIEVNFPAFAQSFSGEITDIKGSVQVSTSSQSAWMDAVAGMPVMAGYRIKTAPESSCNLELDDGSLLFVNGNSSTSVEYLEIGKDKHNSRFSLWLGKILANIEKSRNTKMEIRTPTSIAAVRGTEFALEVSSDVTQVGVFDGQVAVSNPAVSTEEVLLSPDEETSVEKEMQPSRPGKLKEVMLRNKERMQEIRGKVKALKEKLKRVPPEERDKTRKAALERFAQIKENRMKLKDKIKKRNDKLKQKKS